MIALHLNRVNKKIKTIMGKTSYLPKKQKYWFTRFLGSSSSLMSTVCEGKFIYYLNALKAMNDWYSR